MFSYSPKAVVKVALVGVLFPGLACQGHRPPSAATTEQTHEWPGLTATTEKTGEKPEPMPLKPEERDGRRRDGWSHQKIDNPEALFPELSHVLSDPKSDPWDVGRAFWIVGEAKSSNRQQFVALAVARLSDPDKSVRRAALWCLEDIGGEREAAHLVPLLSDDELTIHYAAAEVLAAIGGQRELVAMDAWLIAGAGRHRDPKSLQHVKECRDALEKRLATTPKLLKG